MPTWEIPDAPPSGTYMARIEALEGERVQPVAKQHVVSQVVLKGFAAPGPKGRGWQLRPYDVVSRRELKARSVRECGRVLNFLPFASGSAEALWGTIENKLDGAIQAARCGRLHEVAGAAETVKDGIALHFARSIRYLHVHRVSVSRAINQIVEEEPVLRASLLEAEFHRRYGIHAAGLEALAALLDEPVARWREMDANGRTARVSMEQMFDRVRETLRPLPLEVWHAPLGYEFLISDSPAFTFKYSADQTTIFHNMAIGDSQGIALPLARDCMVAIGAEDKDEVMGVDPLNLFNKLQILVAHRWVYYRPNSSIKQFVEATVREP